MISTIGSNVVHQLLYLIAASSPKEISICGNLSWKVPPALRAMCVPGSARVLRSACFLRVDGSPGRLRAACEESRFFDLKWAPASAIDHDHLLPNQAELRRNLELKGAKVRKSGQSAGAWYSRKGFGSRKPCFRLASSVVRWNLDSKFTPSVHCLFSAVKPPLSSWQGALSFQHATFSRRRVGFAVHLADDGGIEAGGSVARR